ncbi:MAG TPA: urea amidolyase associated protein UAAP1 [Polyangiales bacterium]|nr:urea amidolyase associated protein UAAP1 [Polyangiales bacterium]
MDIPKERVLLNEGLPGAAMWSGVLPRHHTLRLTDVAGGANVSMLLFNREIFSERYNMADTLKAQHTAFLTKGHVLYSDMGRVLCSITEDTVGWHDTFTGLSDAESVRAAYGEKRYGDARNGFHRSAREQITIELGKWGLGQRDLMPNVNWFSKVVPDHAGDLHFVTDHSTAGGYVELRAEMHVLIVLSTCAHVFDPGKVYAPKPVGLCVWKSDPPGPDDFCRRSRPENERGFANTERMFLGRA